MLPDSPRILVSLPAWHFRYLLLWARLKKQSQSELIQNVVQARVEANQDQIDRMVADLAALEGMTPDQLKAQIWAEFGLEDPKLEDPRTDD